METEIAPAAIGIENVNLDDLSGKEGYELARAEIRDELKFILDTWEKGRYDSDKERWGAYAKDIMQLAETLGDFGHEGVCEEAHPGMDHEEWETQQGE